MGSIAAAATAATSCTFYLKDFRPQPHKLKHMICSHFFSLSLRQHRRMFRRLIYKTFLCIITSFVFFHFDPIAESHSIICIIFCSFFFVVSFHFATVFNAHRYFLYTIWLSLVAHRSGSNYKLISYLYRKRKNEGSRKKNQQKRNG